MAREHKNYKCYRFNSGKNMFNKTMPIKKSKRSGRQEGLYIDLMNKLKLDFDDKAKLIQPSNVPDVVIINRSISQMIVMTRAEMVAKLISKSFTFEDGYGFTYNYHHLPISQQQVSYTFPQDRERFILNLNKPSFYTINNIKALMGKFFGSYMKVNPKWKPIPPNIERLRVMYI